MTEALLLFALTEFVFSLSPGPAVFLVMSRSTSLNFVAGACVAAGVIFVNTLYFLLSAIGIGTALIAMPEAFMIIKYAGAAYLMWTAIGILHGVFARRRKKGDGETASIEAQVTSSSTGLTKRILAKCLMAGILTQASSPKNIAIFLSIIPQFIDHTQPVWPQFIWLCIVSVLVELPVLIFYAYLASTLAKRVRSPTFRNYLDGLSAMVLMGIAGTMLVLR